jgi:hypothetical protein
MAPLPCCGGGHRVGDDFFAAFPILTAIAHWTGKIGTVYIKRLIVKGKTNEAKRKLRSSLPQSLAPFFF